MKDKVKIECDKFEMGIIINALNEFRNSKLKENADVDLINDLLLKVVNIYDKKYPKIQMIKKDYAR